MLVFRIATARLDATFPRKRHFDEVIITSKLGLHRDE